jgi:mRNA interferase RelE/StbE
MAYSVELSPEGLSGLEKLTQKHQERILHKIRWLAAHFNELSPIALTGDLSGFFKLRVGDYRVLYSFSETTEIITVHRIGHRREIYL